ncbi:NAD(+)/NADH kinase [bacterium]|nr:NAD(+)/NADH kinase [bacterium]
MKPVGIIANPSSGKDIRRLVASGTVISNIEKANTVRRILLGLDSMGVENAFIMRDCANIGSHAIRNANLTIQVNYLDLPMTNCQQDSTRSAAALDRMGAACIIVLGGDGTNRVVAKGCGDTPLLSVSTGTNNAFCEMVEGTLVGLGAAVMALGIVAEKDVVEQMPVLEVWKGDDFLDIALVDLVVSSMEHVGSRAIWDESTLEEVFLTRSEPGNIGFSSLGWHLHPTAPLDPFGLHILIGAGQYQVKAPIAPGLIRTIPIRNYQLLPAGESIRIHPRRGIIALDGEREHSMSEEDVMTVRYNPKGPKVVNLKRALKNASRSKHFLIG